MRSDDFYQSIFFEAFKAYSEGKVRLGRPAGLMDFFCHTKNLYPAIDKLKYAIFSATTHEEAKKKIEEFLQNSKTTFRNRSFASYLLDELVKADGHAWHKFDPGVIITYKGILYRGCFTPPEIAFDDGLKSSDSRHGNVEDYIGDVTGAVGISATKSWAVAESYVTPSWQRIKSDFLTSAVGSFIYVIHYNGRFGIDIKATLSARRCSFSACLAAAKDEVNIMEAIPASCIKGVWVRQEDGSFKFKENPNYYSSIAAGDYAPRIAFHNAADLYDDERYSPAPS